MWRNVNKIEATSRLLSRIFYFIEHLKYTTHSKEFDLWFMIKVPPNNACSNNWYHHCIGWSNTFSKTSSSSCYKWGRWGWCLISFLHAWKVMFHCGSEEEIKRIERILHFWHFEPSKRMGKCNAYHSTNPFVLDFICYSPHTFYQSFPFFSLKIDYAIWT